MSRSFLPASFALCAAVALAASAAAAPASVQVDNGQAAQAFHYTAADLRTVAGAKAIAVRLRWVASDLCAGHDPLAHVSDGVARCREATIDRALATMNAPLVAQALGRPAISALAQR